MKITIKEDAMGCLHMWAGDVLPTGMKYTWKVDGEWADTYVQSEDDVRHIKEQLKPVDLELLEYGHSITVDYLPEEYVTPIQ
jgi:hypothetical protein